LKIIFDASSIINLINGDAIDSVLALPDSSFFIGPLVLEECKQQQELINALIREGSIELLDDTSMSASVFSALQQRYDLGVGETECLAFAIDEQLTVACDDHKAREMISGRLTSLRVIGSISLLSKCVQQGLISPEDAETKYRRMKARGGFLPNLQLGYFKQAIN
jgi:predicted nucleic acid-binding protein